MTLLRHFDSLGTARFVTFSCHERRNLLSSVVVRDELTKHLDWMRDHYRVSIFGYVVMPEHVHLVLLPSNETKLGPVIGHLKSRFASKVIRERLVELPADCRVKRDGRERVAFWQRRCFDHNCRTSETVREKIHYCHVNPVKRGLVESPEQWRWSSSSWYAGSDNVPLAIDTIVL